MNTLEEHIEPPGDPLIGQPAEPTPVPTAAEADGDETFHTSDVISVALAHGTHDTYFAFLPTILPLLIQNLSLTTTQAGLLTSFTQIPNLLQPVIGHLSDRKNLKYLVILAPTLSGVLISLVGIAPSYGVAALLLILAGFSTAGFHAIAPAMASAKAGRKVGRGMGFFMVGGEMGFGLGPLIVVATIGFLTIRGLPWLMTLGMLASVILNFRLKDATTVRHAQAEAGLPVREALLEMRSIMLPIIGILLITAFLNVNIVNYLPTFMTQEGVSFALAGASLTILELSGTVGVFLMGLYGDRIGHRRVAMVGTIASAAFSLAFLLTRGGLQMAMLVAVGLTSLVANPAFLSIIQTRFKKNRALANGVYMSSSFVLRSIVVVVVGALADRFGLRAVFAGSAVGSLLALPLIFMLPKE
jgi:MFS transporter, FSR family, fosmidomycin resistance protein